MMNIPGRPSPPSGRVGMNTEKGPEVRGKSVPLGSTTPRGMFIVHGEKGKKCQNEREKRGFTRG